MNMAERAQPAEPKAPGAEAPVVTPPTPPRRGPGHRGQDMRDTVAEMAARAHEISQEAGSKMAGALRDTIHAASGIAGFAIESARDLVQYMVRRGQMTQEDADKLIREAEEANSKRKPINGVKPVVAAVAAPAKSVVAAALPAQVPVVAHVTHVPQPVHVPQQVTHAPHKSAPAPKPAPAKAAPAPAKAKVAAKPAAKAHTKPVAKAAPKKAAPAKAKKR